VGSIAAAPHTLWVINYFGPISAEKRAANRVLMDFLDEGWAEKLGLRAHEAVWAVSHDRMGEFGLTPRHRIVFLVPGGRGVIFYATELYASEVVDYALSSGFDAGLRLGGSTIQFAFRSEDRNQIRQVIEQVSAGRVRLIDRGIVYSKLRAGPAGKWMNDHLGSAPPPTNGLVAYGPYIDLEPGQYRMSYQLELARPCGMSAGQLPIRLSVTANSGKTVLPMELNMLDLEFRDNRCRVEAVADFRVDNRAFSRAIEFPLWNEGPIPFFIEDIRLVRIEQEAGSPT
jgi:hypothetical protein